MHRRTLIVLKTPDMKHSTSQDINHQTLTDHPVETTPHIDSQKTPPKKIQKQIAAMQEYVKTIPTSHKDAGIIKSQIEELYKQVIKYFQTNRDLTSLALLKLEYAEALKTLLHYFPSKKTKTNLTEKMIQDEMIECYEDAMNITPKFAIIYLKRMMHAIEYLNNYSVAASQINHIIIYDPDTQLKAAFEPTISVDIPTYLTESLEKLRDIAVKQNKEAKHEYMLRTTTISISLIHHYRPLLPLSIVNRLLSQAYYNRLIAREALKVAFSNSDYNAIMEINDSLYCDLAIARFKKNQSGTLSSSASTIQTTATSKVTEEIETKQTVQTSEEKSASSKEEPYKTLKEFNNHPCLEKYTLELEAIQKELNIAYSLEPTPENLTKYANLCFELALTYLKGNHPIVRTAIFATLLGGLKAHPDITEANITLKNKLIKLYKNEYYQEAYDFASCLGTLLCHTIEDQHANDQQKKLANEELIDFTKIKANSAFKLGQFHIAAQLYDSLLEHTPKDIQTYENARTAFHSSGVTSPHLHFPILYQLIMNNSNDYHTVVFSSTDKTTIKNILQKHIKSLHEELTQKTEMKSEIPFKKTKQAMTKDQFNVIFMMLTTTEDFIKTTIDDGELTLRLFSVMSAGVLYDIYERGLSNLNHIQIKLLSESFHKYSKIAIEKFPNFITPHLYLALYYEIFEEDHKKAREKFEFIFAKAASEDDFDYEIDTDFLNFVKIDLTKILEKNALEILEEKFEKSMRQNKFDDAIRTTTLFINCINTFKHLFTTEEAKKLNSRLANAHLQRYIANDQLEKYDKAKLDQDTILKLDIKPYVSSISDYQKTKETLRNKNQQSKPAKQDPAIGKSKSKNLPRKEKPKKNNAAEQQARREAILFALGKTNTVTTSFSTQAEENSQQTSSENIPQTQSTLHSQADSLASTRSENSTNKISGILQTHRKQDEPAKTESVKQTDLSDETKNSESSKTQDSSEHLATARPTTRIQPPKITNPISQDDSKVSSINYEELQSIFNIKKILLFFNNLQTNLDAINGFIQDYIRISYQKSEEIMDDIMIAQKKYSISDLANKTTNALQFFSEKHRTIQIHTFEELIELLTMLTKKIIGHTIYKPLESPSTETLNSWYNLISKTLNAKFPHSDVPSEQNTSQTSTQPNQADLILSSSSTYSQSTPFHPSPRLFAPQQPNSIPQYPALQVGFYPIPAIYPSHIPVYSHPLPPAPRGHYPTPDYRQTSSFNSKQRR